MTSQEEALFRGVSEEREDQWTIWDWPSSVWKKPKGGPDCTLCIEGSTSSPIAQLIKNFPISYGTPGGGHYCVYKRSAVVTAMCQRNLVHTASTSMTKIHFNIILLPSPRCS
jgi:hypothetical protein